MLVDPQSIRLENLKPYIALMERLLAGEIDLGRLESLYFDLFKKDETLWAEAEYNVLNRLFSDLDCYDSDPDLRDSDDLDDDQMLARVPMALEELKSIVAKYERNRIS